MKKHGCVYTPTHIVNIILDFGGYNTTEILNKHVIDNSCGNGAFLIEIVNRYCSIFSKTNTDLSALKKDLETYVHGIELNTTECQACIQNLNSIADKYGLSGIKWDVLNSYNSVKKFKFAEEGMTDLYIVFFEIGFKMLSKDGVMCLITPSSWLSSLAGKKLREYIMAYRNLSGVIDLEHYQPFQATTYTIISRFSNLKRHSQIEYFNFDEVKLDKCFQDKLKYDTISISKNLHLSKNENLELLRKIKTSHSYSYVSVKNGFATLADKIFIGDFDFNCGTIHILKASTGKWSKCIYPYDELGKPMTQCDFMKNKEAYAYLLSHQDKLTKGRDIENDKHWFLFGRTQALKDVSKTKYAINTIVKDLQSIKLEIVPKQCGIYSGLYILTYIDFQTIKELIYCDDFIEYIKLLKNYKSGGYYTYTSKDLELYLNFKLTEKYGQSRISSSRELF